MNLYDSLIADTMEVLKASEPRIVSYSKGSAWPLDSESSFIMQRESGLELGAGGLPTVNYTCVTTSGLVSGDEVIIAGPEISGIKGNTAFARIVILETDELGEETDTEAAFQAVRNIEFVRYHVFPKGYMVRVSSQSDQEQVRISKEAQKNGISFERVGCAYIDKYHEVSKIRHVRVIFVTDQKIVERLLPNAAKTSGITRTLTHILDGLPADCSHCSMKPVCDEVEGMKELHLGRKK